MDASPVAEEYIKQIHRLEAEHGRRVRTTELATAVDRTKASATSMVQKLDKQGLVDHEEYSGVRLTAAGEAVADRLIRKHRLLETALVDHLGVPATVAHEEADRLEHHVSDGVADRLAEVLAIATPVPNARLAHSNGEATTRLADADPGDVVVVVSVPRDRPVVRTSLRERGVEPGAVVEVDDCESTGALVVTSASTARPVAVPEPLAERVAVRPLPGCDTVD